MKTIGNILWFIFGGWLLGLAWLLAALFMLVSIVGIPFVRAALNMSQFALLPFGKQVINRHEVTVQKDIGTSIFGAIGNIVWFIFAGLWLGLLHMVVGIGLFCTIIAIPFAIQHFKLAVISFTPIGQKVVSNYMYDFVKSEQVKQELASIRKLS